MKIGREDGQKEKGGNKRKRKQSTKGKVVKKGEKKAMGEKGEKRKEGVQREATHPVWRTTDPGGGTHCSCIAKKKNAS